MKYYFDKKITGNFEETIQRVKEALSNEGFGVLTEINVRETLKKKLGEDFYNYRILGACNPPYALKALLAEDKIGTILPCNVIIQERKPGKIEVSAINPMSSMKSVLNEELQPIAAEISSKLKKVVKEL